MSFFIQLVGTIALVVGTQFSPPLVSQDDPVLMPSNRDLTILSHDDKMELGKGLSETFADAFNYDDWIFELSSDENHFWVHFYCDTYKNGEYAGQDEVLIEPFQFTTEGVLALEPQFHPGCPDYY